MHLARDAHDFSNASDSTSFNASIADGKSNSSLAKRHEKHPPSMTTPAPTPSPTLQPTPSRTPQPTSPAQLFQFYIYRAASAMAMDYEFGNINVGNAEGVVWYLQNEVVTNYNAGAQCPRKFDISQINRYKVKTRATKELFETGVNFGVRYSYDFGQCMGRCLPGNQCTGKDDCDYHYDKFGYNVGCNKFADGYPFPPADVHAPNGIWYSLPLEGRCEGEPTGDSDCTWSYEDAGVVTLEELEAMQPWGDNCCNDKCTGIWDNPFDDGSASWRVQMFQDKFEEKYPEWPRDLWPAPCDFWKEKWYTSETDWWEPRDPWAEQRAAEQAAQWVERDDENER
jgi:hypothetical protein